MKEVVSGRRRKVMYQRPEVYEAILFLRRRGHRVWRPGTWENPAVRDRHMLDGQIVPSSWLLDMARVEGWRPRSGEAA